jgi:hypothetical protein
MFAATAPLAVLPFIVARSTDRFISLSNDGFTAPPLVVVRRSFRIRRNSPFSNKNINGRVILLSGASSLSCISFNRLYACVA